MEDRADPAPKPPERRFRTVRDAFVTRFGILPAHLVDGSRYDPARKLVLGAVYDADYRLVSEALRLGGSEGGDHVTHYAPDILSKAYFRRHRARTLPGKTVFLGHFFNHYGHFITEGVSRLHGLRNMRHYDRFVFLPFSFQNGRVWFRDFHRLIFDAFGIPQEKIVVVGTRFFRFERLDVYPQLWPINCAPDPGLRRSYARIAGRFEDGPPRGRVFLSRDPARNARIRNLPDLERTFRRRGFAIVRAEDLSYAEQLKLYANTAVLAAPAGSGMHNALFLQPGSLAIEIGDPRTPHAFAPMQAHANALSRARVARIPYRGAETGEIDVAAADDALTAILAGT